MSNQDENLRDPRAATSQRLLSDGLLVAIASGLAYLTIYSFQVGICDYFNIPHSVITIAVPNLIAVTLGMLFAVLFLSIVLDMIPSEFVRYLGYSWPVLLKLARFRGHFLLSREGSTNGQKTSQGIPR